MFRVARILVLFLLGLWGTLTVAGMGPQEPVPATGEGAAPRPCHDAVILPVYRLERYALIHRLARVGHNLAYALPNGGPAAAAQPWPVAEGSCAPASSLGNWL